MVEAQEGLGQSSSVIRRMHLNLLRFKLLTRSPFKLPMLFMLLRIGPRACLASVRAAGVFASPRLESQQQ